MAQAKNTKKKKKLASKVSLHYKPSNMSLEQWQIALRKQAAEKEQFAISFIDHKQSPGDYWVANPTTKHEYKVVYRGVRSEWNYCSCMDYKTSQLGTCKHIEAVKLWLRKKRLGVPGKETPSYTSVYLSYKGERAVKLRIGTDNEAEFRKLAEPYFTPEGELKADSYYSVSVFLHKAKQISESFRCYNDALSYILEYRDKERRKRLIEEKYPNGKVDGVLNTTLYPYQHQGILFAAQAGKCIIADEMGLGKTIQALGTAELLRQGNFISSALILCPTSLKYQWKSEIKRFTGADAIVVEGNHLTRKELYNSDIFYKIVSYNAACNDLKILKSLHTDMLIMDEAQRLKNWKTQIAQAIKRIHSDYSVILSGTPLENKLEDLYSVAQYIDQYCLGPYYKFLNRYTIASETGQITGYQHLNEIGRLLSNILIRRRKRDVALQLPERMDKILLIPMTKEQQEIHEENKHQVSVLVNKWKKMRFLSEKDRKRLLLYLSVMRMVCDSTYILDQKTRYDTKIEELMNILSNIFESGDEKVVIFSQWERMTRLVVQELDKLGVKYEYLHGGIPSQQRKDLVQNFTNDPESRVFISTDAGSTGLNLQAASTIINLDLPWNPAVLEQRIARIYRIGQKRNIQVLNFVSKDTIEERMLSTLTFKSSLFEGILDNGSDSVFMEESKFNKLMHTVDDLTLTKEEAVETGTSTINMSDLETTVEEKEEKKEEKPTPSEKPEELVQQGLKFFSDLANTLSSPEKTQELVSSIVEEDKETGQTMLKIPVQDKETVVNVLSMLGKLFKNL